MLTIMDHSVWEMTSHFGPNYPLHGLADFVAVACRSHIFHIVVEAPVFKCGNDDEVLTINRYRAVFHRQGGQIWKKKRHIWATQVIQGCGGIGRHKKGEFHCGDEFVDGSPGKLNGKTCRGKVRRSECRLDGLLSKEEEEEVKWLWINSAASVQVSTSSGPEVMNFGNPWGLYMHLTESNLAMPPCLFGVARLRLGFYSQTERLIYPFGV